MQRSVATFKSRMCDVFTVNIAPRTKRPANAVGQQGRSKYERRTRQRRHERVDPESEGKIGGSARELPPRKTFAVLMNRFKNHGSSDPRRANPGPLP